MAGWDWVSFGVGVATGCAVMWGALLLVQALERADGGPDDPGRWR